MGMRVDLRVHPHQLRLFHQTLLAAAGNTDALGVIFQRTVLFLLPHCGLISGAFVTLPSLLRALGQPPQLCSDVRLFILALLPALWLDALNRRAAAHKLPSRSPALLAAGSSAPCCARALLFSRCCAALTVEPACCFFCSVCAGR